ncbi:hypothetical protein [Acetobacter senegalensis]|uniref:hypothetical protein n=1 Tax=Acetobacter senegalensis TaxID=446692 RepID=UPI0026560E39|nr:hypothetical protein [Acetobacter senegalensis]MDN7354358.1 hypothetical protein [Acetobacter senegalensis]
MSVQATVIQKLFRAEGEILDVKFFPGSDAVGSEELIWSEFGKALEQLESGEAEVSSHWTGTTPTRSLAAFIASR